jgi:curved DNA-binding protein CbpA
VTLYELLGADASADGAELGRAYRRRLRQLHPDIRSATVAEDRLEPAVDLAAVQHAYQVLRDPARRVRYDAELRARAAGTLDDARRRSVGSRVPIAVRVHHPSRPRGSSLIRVGRVRVDPLPPSPHR